MNKRHDQLQINSNFVANSQNYNIPLKKNRNIPAQIWLKRNVIKKLTVQLKFNKASTNQYKKFRQQSNEYQNSPKIQNNSVKNIDHINNQYNVIATRNKNQMKKLSSAKARNLNKYTENYFDSNVFSRNGLNSCPYMLTNFQDNNFIKVQKAILVQKKCSQKIKDNNSYRKSSQSQRSMVKEKEDEVFKHKRSFSNPQIYQQRKQPQSQKNTDFLKVSSKALHFNNIQNFLRETAKSNQSIFAKRLKSQPKANQGLLIQISKLKTKQIQTKFQSKRPKSCIIKAKKTFQITNCQGWITGKSARQDEEPFPNLFRL